MKRVGRVMRLSNVPKKSKYKIHIMYKYLHEDFDLNDEMVRPDTQGKEQDRERHGQLIWIMPVTEIYLKCEVCL